MIHEQKHKQLCELCGQYFIDVRLLRQHTENVHGGTTLGTLHGKTPSGKVQEQVRVGKSRFC